MLQPRPLFIVLLSFMLEVAAANEIVGAPVVQCTDTALTFTIRTRTPFKGKIFVPDHFDTPNCRVDYGKNDYAGATFAIRISDCGMQRVRQLQPPGMNYLLAVTASFHPVLITKEDRSYRIRCFYAHVDQAVNNALNVSPLPTQQVEQATVIRPECVYSIRLGSLDGPVAQAVTVGDRVVHRWECANPNYGMLVKNCYVNNGGSGGVSVQLVDERGCPMTQTMVQSPLIYDPSGCLVSAVVETYKFPDIAKVAFHCQIEVCAKADNQCLGVAPPNCPTLSSGQASVETPSSSAITLELTRQRKGDTGPGILEPIPLGPFRFHSLNGNGQPAQGEATAELNPHEHVTLHIESVELPAGGEGTAPDDEDNFSIFSATPRPSVHQPADLLGVREGDAALTDGFVFREGSPTPGRPFRPFPFGGSRLLDAFNNDVAEKEAALPVQHDDVMPTVVNAVMVDAHSTNESQKRELMGLTEFFTSGDPHLESPAQSPSNSSSSPSPSAPSTLFASSIRRLFRSSSAVSPSLIPSAATNARPTPSHPSSSTSPLPTSVLDVSAEVFVDQHETVVNETAAERLSASSLTTGKEDSAFASLFSLSSSACLDRSLLAVLAAAFSFTSLVSLLTLFYICALCYRTRCLTREDAGAAWPADDSSSMGSSRCSAHSDSAAPLYHPFFGNRQLGLSRPSSLALPSHLYSPR